LYSTRLVTLPSDPDFSTITDGSKGTSKEVSSKVGKFWSKLGLTRTRHVPKTLQVRRWHFSTKQGPNGFTLSSLVWDAKSLVEDQVKALEILGGRKVTDSVNFIRYQSDETLSILHPLKPGKGITSRRIAVFPDMEGKTRIIAELDYFSQASLRPLHLLLFRILKSIRQDYTFNQDGAKDSINKWNKFYSCDLTAATDRFPISLISKVLLFLPAEYVQA